jgi:hypothetical protein
VGEGGERGVQLCLELGQGGGAISSAADSSQGRISISSSITITVLAMILAKSTLKVMSGLVYLVLEVPLLLHGG